MLAAAPRRFDVRNFQLSANHDLNAEGVMDDVGPKALVVLIRLAVAGGIRGTRFQHIGSLILWHLPVVFPPAPRTELRLIQEAHGLPRLTVVRRKLHIST